MRPADLAAVLDIAAVVHPDYPEDPAVFAERLALFPAGCLVLENFGGYLIAHPWRHAAPPPLNALLGALPVAADTLYLHDIALLPAARGHGLARAGVARVAALAKAEGLREVALVAVGDAGGFWAAQGFEALVLPELAGKLASYDSTAAYMRRAV
jgi:GNAT superfamily N-acetyltransferase